jgi:rSAM/selenodomain-associated transferase 1
MTSISRHPPDESPTPDDTRDEHLIVFARIPRLGEVKTRLAAGLGAEGALAAYRELLDHALAQASACTGVTRWLCLSGEDPQGEGERLASRHRMRLSRQAPGDLGWRMRVALRDCLARGRRAVLIGCDSPPIDASLLREAFDALRDRDLVFAPTEDGGYALVGARTDAGPIFSAIDWSTDRVMAQTRERAGQSGLSVAELPRIWDVDEPADWQRFLDWRDRQTSAARGQTGENPGRGGPVGQDAVGG